MNNTLRFVSLALLFSFLAPTDAAEERLALEVYSGTLPMEVRDQFYAEVLLNLQGNPEIIRRIDQLNWTIDSGVRILIVEQGSLPAARKRIQEVYGKYIERMEAPVKDAPKQE